LRQIVFKNNDIIVKVPRQSDCILLGSEMYLLLCVGAVPAAGAGQAADPGAAALQAGAREAEARDTDGCRREGKQQTHELQRFKQALETQRAAAEKVCKLLI
jgi:hypothetical protein